MDKYFDGVVWVHPCGMHTHATEKSRKLCQSEYGMCDFLPDIELSGRVWARRGGHGVSG